MSKRAGFDGLSVLTLESRRATEQATLIARFNGTPIVAPSLREVPLESQTEAVEFVRAAVGQQFDCVIFLTGVGARALLSVAASLAATDAFVGALAAVRIVVRGPKPLSVMREFGVPVWIAAPEPNTWREVLAAIDAAAAEFPIAGARVAVQEYGVSNPSLIDALRSRGAFVTTVPIYQWALPEDTGPLRDAVGAIVRGGIDVIILTSGVQLVHLYEVARQMGEDARLTTALQQVVCASIGPTCSEEIRRHGLVPDLEASHPKMGILVTETAEQAGTILERKRRAAPGSSD